MADLSEHFSRAELTHTDTGLPNEPDSEAIWERLAQVAAVLERIRTRLRAVKPEVTVHVNSGYRGPAVNLKVHGSDTSAHSLGLAADIVPQGMDLLDAYHLIRHDPELMADIDQLILEQKPCQRGGYVRWIHVGVGHMGPGGELAALRHQTLVFSPLTKGHYPPFDQKYVV